MQIEGLPLKEKEGIFAAIRDRFGLERDVFEGADIFRSSKGRIFMASGKAASLASRSHPATAGLLFAREDATIKVSSNIIMMFGQKATKNVLDIDRKLAKEFIEGLDLDVDSKLEDGYVIVKYRNYPLGVGLLKRNKVKNMLPKGKRINVELF